MKLIQRINLGFQQGNSDKVYEVDLCEVGPDQYVVNFRYGRRGTALKDGSKTPLPVDLQKAQQVYDKLVLSKTKKGYLEQSDAPSPLPAAARRAPDPGSLEKRKQKVLEQLQENLDKQVPSHHRSLDRLLWSAGRLKIQEAAPLLNRVAQSTSRSDMTDYCLAWAMGQCGDQYSLPTLKELWMDNWKAEWVKRIAKVAYLALLNRLQMDAQRWEFYQEVHGNLPRMLHDLVAQNADAEEMGKVLNTYLESGLKPHQFDVINEIYLLDHGQVRAALLWFLKTVPLRPNYFKQLRRLFKAAELKQDAEVFGILVHRFEKEQPYVRLDSYEGTHGFVGVGQWDERKWMHVKKEIVKKNSKAAYTNRSRDFFRRRAWRTLKELADIDGRQYVKQAVGILLQVTDDDAGEPQTVTTYDWYGNANPSIYYDIYCRLYNFNRILFHYSLRYLCRNLTFVCRSPYKPGDPAPAAREEAFPGLWDQHPRALLHLLSDSKCGIVHDFAVKALWDNPAFCEKLDKDVIIMLLSRAYAITQRMGLKLAQQRLDADNPDVDLLVALLGCALDQARQLAAQVVKEATFSMEQAQTLVNAFVDRLVVMTSASDGEGAVAIADLLIQTFPAVLREMDLERIERMLQQGIAEVQTFAGQVLAMHRVPVEQLPDWMLQHLMESQHESVRRAGTALFGRLPLHTLFNKEGIVLGFCISPLGDMRQSVRPILKKLADTNHEFGTDLAKTLSRYLLQKEPVEGFHQDLTITLLESMDSCLSLIPKELMMQLLNSRSTVVQSFGGHLLINHSQPTDFDVRGMMKFSHHDIVEARAYAHKWCKENVPLLKEQMHETVRVFDTEWEDTRRFGFFLFKELLSPEDLTPDVMVGICDSVRPDVQRFGCDLITGFFKQEDGVAYLLKLSQHPSANLQLFVTNYLARFASGNVERIRHLENYFVTVLSRVNRARVAKERILAFFKNEIQGSREIADIIAAILKRVSLTIAIGNKASYIRFMRDMQALYPDTAVPITVHPPEHRQPAAGVGHGI